MIRTSTHSKSIRRGEPPRWIQNDKGRITDVILSIDDLRVLAHSADWEQLPTHLQDAVDNLLADDALNEGSEKITLDEFMKSTKSSA